MAKASPVAPSSPGPNLPGRVNHSGVETASRCTHCEHATSQERGDLPGGHYVVPHRGRDWGLLSLTHCLHLTLGRGISHGRVDGGDAALPRIVLSPGVNFALRSDGKAMRLCDERSECTSEASAAAQRVALVEQSR